MQIKIFRLSMVLLIAAISLNLQKGFAQNKAGDLTDSLQELEGKIRVKLLFNETRQKLESIKNKAIALNENILVARALNDLLLIRDQRSEDTLYFRNSAFMDTLLSSPSTPAKLKAILHVMRARRIAGFSQHYLTFNNGAYRATGLLANVAMLTGAQRDSLVINDLNAALNANITTDATQLTWLSSDPGIFLFYPSFADIVALEKINLLAPTGYGDRPDYLGFKSWLSLPPDVFRAKLENSNNIKRPYALYYYGDWIAMHKNSPEIAAFIESLAHKYLYLSLPPDSATRACYALYLQQSINSPYQAVKAHAVYQLCLLWNQDGNKYANVFYNGLIKINTDYQYYPAKALQLYQDHRQLIAKYPVFDKVLRIMADQIKYRGLQIITEKEHAPGKEIPVKVVYKNTGTLYYRIVKVAADEPPRNKTKLPATAQLFGKPPVAQGTFALPLPADNNRHSVYLKLGALAAGHYQMLFSYMPMKVNGYDLDFTTFNVTAIAPVNTDNKLFVLDRESGFPLEGAGVTAYRKQHRVNQPGSYVINKNGFVDIKSGTADSVVIAYKGDTTGYSFQPQNYDLPDKLYDADVNTDLPGFYDDKMRVEVFTDRGIYRPGQSMHYKVIFLTNNPLTGEAIPFTIENVGQKIFEAVTAKWKLAATDKLKLKDPFGKLIDSASIKLNEFGSFSGTFTLPKSAATGDWRMDAEPDAGYNSGEFKVEEYKRPGIELKTEPQKSMLRPGNPFTIHLKLRSFSGASLNNIPITYTVNRAGYLPRNNPVNRDHARDYTDTIILSQTGNTDKNGDLAIAVNDSALAKLTLADSVAWTFSYTVKATAVDATGESTDVNSRFEASTRPVRIAIPIGTKESYDRQALPQLKVTATGTYEGAIAEKVNIKLYRIVKPVAGDAYSDVDQWYYKQADWNKWFPDKAVLPPAPEEKMLVLDTMVNSAAYQLLLLPENLMEPAPYRLVATVKENGKTIGQSVYSFNIFDSKSGVSAQADMDYLPFNMVKKGDILTWYSAADTDSYAIYQVLYLGGGNKPAVRNIYRFATQKRGIYRWRYKIPADVTKNLTINRIIVKHNKIFNRERIVYLSDLGRDPLEIIVEKYRKVMTPGATESFTVSVKTKNNNVAAELMTTLYDASLDKLSQHSWQPVAGNRYQQDFSTSWNYTLTDTKTAGEDVTHPYLYDLAETFKGTLPGMGAESLLQGKAAGISINSSEGLNEVVAVGYGGMKYTAYSRSNVIRIRGANSLLDYKQPLIVVDGVIYTGDLRNINTAGIYQAMVLKAADASALFGARGAAGVLIISTKGPITLPGSEEPVIKVRKNFNETAFFYPEIHADKDGYYRFSFTMPETATEWNWQMLAHNQKGRFAYLEKKLQTQLSLMVQPNVPRLLYQGDKITLQTRISNLDTTVVKGKATCTIEDAITGDDITALLTATNSQPFKLAQKSSGNVGFVLQVPAQQLNPLKIIISAASGSAADAEEHIIPVMSPRILLRQSQVIRFNGRQTVTLAPPKLPEKALLYSLTVSIQQKPQAALLYALPWLAGYSFDCAEQTFNKLRAQVTGLTLMRTDSSARQEFQKAAATVNKGKPADSALPGDMAEAAMPWQGLAGYTANRQGQLYHLLDSSRSIEAIDKHIARLYELQQPDGGLSWFDGGKSNAYISAYILAGFGQLGKNWQPATFHRQKEKHFLDALAQYQQRQISSVPAGLVDIFELYALSYWLKVYPPDQQLKEKISLALGRYWSDVNNLSLQQQALLVINTLRYTNKSNPLNKKALQLLESIRQLAVNDDANGLRWKDIAGSEDLDSSSEETMALLSEAFEQAGQEKQVNAGIVKWLLTAKQSEHWQTTKATAAAINMLQKEKGTAFGQADYISGNIGAQQFAVSNDPLTGTPSSFIAVKQLPEKVTVQSNGAAGTGALTWHYFAYPANADTLNKNVKLIKKFFVYGDKENLIALTPGATLKAGDHVQVQLTIESNRRLTFVHISDPRAAAFEPGETGSGYRYQDGLSYYRSIRDTGMELFAESVPDGVSRLSYELVVVNAGEFTSGAAKLECMYQPALTAYSGIEKVLTK